MRLVSTTASRLVGDGVDVSTESTPPCPMCRLYSSVQKGPTSEGGISRRGVWKRRNKSGERTKVQAQMPVMTLLDPGSRRSFHFGVGFAGGAGVLIMCYYIGCSLANGL